jgi:hypothetical protein
MKLAASTDGDILQERWAEFNSTWRHMMNGYSMWTSNGCHKLTVGLRHKHTLEISAPPPKTTSGLGMPC